MKNILIAGATGMIGGTVLRLCLEHNDVNCITSIVRRASGDRHEKLVEIIHDDFADYSALQKLFKDIQVAYFCIGVYTGQVSKDMFRTITVDYAKAFGDMLKMQSPEATLCFLSGQGADQSETSRLMFARDKGVAENHLLRLGLKQTYIFRPAYIYPVQPRNEPNHSYRLLRKLYPIIKIVYPRGVVTSDELAKAMMLVGIEGAAASILENSDIKKLGARDVAND